MTTNDEAFKDAPVIPLRRWRITFPDHTPLRNLYVGPRDILQRLADPASRPPAPGEVLTDTSEWVMRGVIVYRPPWAIRHRDGDWCVYPQYQGRDGDGYYGCERWPSWKQAQTYWQLTTAHNDAVARLRAYA